MFFKNLPSDKVPLNETTKIVKNHNALEFHKTLSEYTFSKKEFFTFETDYNISLNGWMIQRQHWKRQ